MEIRGYRLLNVFNLLQEIDNHFKDELTKLKFNLHFFYILQIKQKILTMTYSMFNSINDISNYIRAVIFMNITDRVT